MPATEVFRNGQSWIQKSPDICGGDACIRDTRIPVWSVVTAARLGTSEEELQTYFVTPLTPADIQAALGYFEEHSEEIENDIRLNQDA